ncbi:MAG: response regulator [Planctomycetes bacterium]|nr:response regulator [Planctomycetota bacterium]
MPADPYKYFRIEARELLEGLGQGALELERGAPASQPVARLLRMAHTLKGAARVVRQPGIADLAHAVEGVLAPHREGDGPVPGERVRELLRLVDAIAALVGSLETPASASVPGAASSAAVASPAARAPAQGAGSALPAAGGETAGPARTPTEQAFETVRVEIGEMDSLLEATSEAGVQVGALRQEADELERARQTAAVLRDLLGPRRASAAAAAAGGGPGALRARSLAEELLGSLDRLQRGIATGIEQTERELSEVRDTVDRLRLVPARAVFASLERAVRDAGQSLGKRVELHARGGENRLDAHVLAALGDALLQLVRNAVAHGIEPEAERTAAGKPPVGRVEVSVERRGTRVAIACSDDGRGIDVEAARRAVVRSGRMGAAAAASLGAEQLLRLLLEGGMSTTASVTEFAGRGIGLDVVRETVARLKGEVSGSSERGRGTTLELRVPVSLSSLAALVVECGDVVASIPLDAVGRCLRLRDEELSRSAERDAIVHEGRLLPFLSLARALRRPEPAARVRRSWSVVVVRSGSGSAAMGVDRLLGTANVVVRPLPACVGADPTVAGASFDAEGNPRLVLDPAGFVAVACAAGRPAANASTGPAAPLLVVDDSLTTRILEQSILEAAGYAVELAASAEEALDRARTRRFSLFLVDIEMPGMDGFEFLGKLRADPVLRDVPAILISSRASPEDRRRGEQAGARAYIVKSDFDQGRLLATIRELIG